MKHSTFQAMPIFKVLVALLLSATMLCSLPVTVIAEGQEVAEDTAVEDDSNTDGASQGEASPPIGIELSATTVFTVLILAAAGGAFIGFSFARRPRKEKQEEDEE